MRQFWWRCSIWCCCIINKTIFAWNSTDVVDSWIVIQLHALIEIPEILWVSSQNSRLHFRPRVVHFKLKNYINKFNFLEFSELILFKFPEQILLSIAHISRASMLWSKYCNCLSHFSSLVISLWCVNVTAKNSRSKIAKVILNTWSTQWLDQTVHWFFVF